MDNAPRQSRVTVDEVRAALRNSGQPAIIERTSVILETDGTLGVVTGLGKAVAPENLKV